MAKDDKQAWTTSKDGSIKLEPTNIRRKYPLPVKASIRRHGFRKQHNVVDTLGQFGNRFNDNLELKNKILCLDIAVCSSWGRRLPKHIFYTQFARQRGHHYCLNCGMTMKQVREEEKYNKANLIEKRVVDYFSDLEKPKFL